MMMKLKSCAVFVLLITLPYLMGITTAYQCGWQAGGRRCGGSLCCSRYGYCGYTSNYCGRGQCQSQCLLDKPDQAAIAWAQAQAAQALEAQAQFPTDKVQVQAQAQAAGAP